jgi:membrane-bound metal-dependent hydrolase YbcI (DUF457 family)
MPFTLFHFGPALAAGLPLRKRIHAPTFIIANVIIDVEPLLVLVLGLNYPLHGYLHSILVAAFAGIALGVAMFLFEKFLQPVWRLFLLETDNKPRIMAFVAAGALGTILHVLFDAPLYTDIQPFYPMTPANPLLNTVSSANMYVGTTWLGVFGIVFYAGVLLFRIFGKFRKNESQSL